MSKRNIVFNKPEDPSFLKKIKESIGYREADTVETKRQRVEYNEDSDSDADTELPQVVVLKPGDLTAEEAEKEKQKLQKEEAEKPADLTQRVIFKATKSKSSTSGEAKATKIKDSKKKAQTSKLSFAADEEEETED